MGSLPQGFGVKMKKIELPPPRPLIVSVKHVTRLDYPIPLNLPNTAPPSWASCFKQWLRSTKYSVDALVQKSLTPRVSQRKQNYVGQWGVYFLYQFEVKIKCSQEEGIIEVPYFCWTQNFTSCFRDFPNFLNHGGWVATFSRSPVQFFGEHVVV